MRFATRSNHPGTLTIQAAARQIWRHARFFLACAVVGHVAGNATIGATTVSAFGFTQASKTSSILVTSKTVLGGTSVTAKVAITGGSANKRWLVQLVSSNSNAAAVPSQVEGTADGMGKGDATFTITTSAVTSSTTVTITAGQGSESKTATLTVNPVAIKSLTVNPSTVTYSETGSRKVKGAITLDGDAPSSGFSVPVSVSDPTVLRVYGSTVSVPAGQRTKDFDIFAKKTVLTPTAVTITAGQGSGAKTATVTANPPMVTWLSLSPSEVVGGSTSVSGSVTIDAAPGALIREYSYGMKKKLALSAALIHGPEMLFLDEPFEGIDPVTGRTIKDILLGLHRKGITVLMSSHILDVVEKLCPQIAIIDRGRLRGFGTMEEIRQSHGSTGSLEQLFIDLMGGAKRGELSWL